MEEDEAQLEREHAEAARKAEEERQKYREKIEEAKRLGERLGKMPPLTKAGADFLRSKDLVLPTDNTKSREVRRKIEIFNPETGKKQEFNVYEEDESDEEGADVRAARMQEAKPTESEKLVVPSATIKRTFKAPQKPKNSDQQSEQPPAQPAN